MAFLSSRSTITVLTLLTAVIHLGLGIGLGDPLFVLNGTGFIGLLYVTFWTPGFLQSQKNLIRWAFIGYTLVTIVLFFVFNGADSFQRIPGLVTKVIELLLLAGLWQSKDS